MRRALSKAYSGLAWLALALGVLQFFLAGLGIFGASSFSAHEGVVSAIQNAGREDEMFLTGAGGSKAAMEQIKEGGLYRATFLYNPSMSASAIRMARLIVRGQGFEELTEPEVPSKITVPATTVTKDNVDDVMELGF